MQPTQPARPIHRLYFALFDVGGVLALLALLRVPSDPDSAWLWGYSRARLLLAGGMAAGILVSALAALRPVRLPLSWRKATENQGALTSALALALCILGVDFLYAVLLWQHIASPLAVRLSPLVGWITWGSGLLLHYLYSNKGHEGTQRSFSRFLCASSCPSWLHSTLWAWGALTALALLVAFTGLGIEPDITGWDYPGAPLLFWQILLAAALGLFAFRLIRRGGRLADGALFLLLWGTAAILWLRAPLKPSHYALQPGPPNFEFTPYSDAALLMLNAEDLLLGEGFQLPAEKPLYNAALALFLALGKHHYLSAVNLQVVVLALFPALVYLVFSTLEQRLAGLVTAGALTLRETNALRLADRINVSHSKLMMTDLPMALGIAAFTWIMLRWLKYPNDWRRSTLAGGALGAAILIRSQAIIFLPIALFLLFVACPKHWKRRLISGGLFTLSVLVTLLPWMVRNRIVTGKFGYAQPMQAVYLESQYSFNPGEFTLADAPLETRLEQGFGSALDFARQHPGYVTRFIASHFFHNEMAALLSLPLRLDLNTALLSSDYSPRAYVDDLPYWNVHARGKGDWTPATLVPLITNLLLLGLGLGTAWRLAHWNGLAPLALHLAYSLSSALARVSGSRFILSADWILIGYYLLGLTTILQALGLHWGQAAQEQLGDKSRPQETRAPRGVVLVAVLGAWMLFGALIPLAEIVIPAYYSPLTLEEARDIINQASSCSSSALRESDTALRGRALFPHFYKADDGYGRGRWAAYNYFPFPRLGFLLAGPQNANVLLPMDEPPPSFPQGADVMVIGRQRQDYLLADAVLLTEGDLQIVYFSATCTP